MNYNFKILLILLAFPALKTFGQDFNNDPSISFINQTTPTSPEAASLGKYGNIPVGEFTGTPDINIPIYTVTNKNLNLPISISYHASGIKVNQEATIAGLGWDLVAGGRISLEVKGSWDKISAVSSAKGQALTDGTFDYIFALPSGPLYQTLLWDYAPVCDNDIWYGGEPHVCQHADVPTIYTTEQWIQYCLDLQSLVDHSYLEPDIYHANFLGYSFSYYEDLRTSQIKFIGEHILFDIQETTNGWKIIDDNGIQYDFEKQEFTKYTYPIEGFYNQIPASWVLTKVIDVDGNYINLNYKNFGEVFPMPEITEYKVSENGVYDEKRNFVNGMYNGYPTTQIPQYLSSITTPQTTIDFKYISRSDLGGSGARSLQKISVTNNLSGNIVKQAILNQDYFLKSDADWYAYPVSTLSLGDATDLDNRLHTRRRLTSIDIGGENMSNKQTYKFYYCPIHLPNKMSPSVDHWGYYNAANNGYYYQGSGGSILPTIESLVNEGILSSNYVSNVDMEGIPKNVDLTLIFNGNANRKAHEYAYADMLQTIVYPTGGKLDFIYESHHSFYNGQTDFIGGGLRIKQITTHSSSSDPGTRIKYEYLTDQGFPSGVYMGAIQYIQFTNKYGNSDYGAPCYKFFSNGNLNDANATVVYSKVIKRILGLKKDYQGNEIEIPNGYEAKVFHIRNPYPIRKVGDYLTPESDFFYMPPTPEGNLDGRIEYEETYNKNNVLKKKIVYNYNFQYVNNEWYAVKPLSEFWEPDRSIAVNVHLGFYFKPVQSFHALLDNTVETNYETSGFLTTTKKYTYNNNYQLESSRISDSKGGESITYTTTPLSYNGLPPVPDITGLQGDAFTIQKLKNQHIYNYPIETISKYKDVGGNETVLKGIYNQYQDNGNLKRSHSLKIASPIPLNQFQPSAYNPVTHDVDKDSRYQLKTTFDYYDATGNLLQYHKNNDVNNSIIWDYQNMYPITQATNANKGEIAYTSFEAEGLGNWKVPSTARNNNSAVTGFKSYKLSNGNIKNLNSLDAGKIYTVSLWAKSQPQITNTLANPKTGRKFNGFKYYEFTTKPGITNITISGSDLIDELRLYPTDAQIITYTYNPLIGMSSKIDQNSNIVYYKYDDFSRLSEIRDADNNIIKKFGYNYAGHKFNPNLYINQMQTQTFAKNDCSQTDYSGSEITDTVWAGTYTSDVSQEQADSLATADLATNGQTKANLNGSCLPRLNIILQNINRVAGFNIVLTSVYDSTKTYTLSFPTDQDSVLSSQKIPQGRYNIFISKINNSDSYVFTVSGAHGDIQINDDRASWVNVPVTADNFDKISISTQ